MFVPVGFAAPGALADGESGKPQANAMVAQRALAPSAREVRPKATST